MIDLNEFHRYFSTAYLNSHMWYTTDLFLVWLYSTIEDNDPDGMNWNPDAIKSSMILDDFQSDEGIYGPVEPFVSTGELNKFDKNCAR